MVKETFEEVTSYFSSGEYGQELAHAKEEYFTRTGRVFEDDPAYEIRMTAFFEWFLCDRVLYDVGIPPIRLYAENFGEAGEEKKKTTLRGLERTKHSLFEFLSWNGEKMKVKDLFSEETFEVAERRTYGGIHKGDLFDGRLIPMRHEQLFSNAIWVHPREVRSLIMKQLPQNRTQGREGFNQFLLTLTYKKWKSEQFKHVPPKQIYEESGPAESKRVNESGIGSST